MQLLQKVFFCNPQLFFKKRAAGKNRLLGYVNDYFSTISRISIGQAFTQMPQAMHLVVGPSAGATMTFMGQISTHLPQEVQSFLLIM